MKLTVLTDNNTIIDRYYLGEPALSFYIEEEGERILFDTGYSDVFLKNAAALGIDLSKLTAIVISHGHNDHTGGLRDLLEAFGLSGVRLIAHPQVFKKRRYEGLMIGSELTAEECGEYGLKILECTKPFMITPRLCFLGEIPRKVPFEGKMPIGECLEDGTWRPDFIRDDSALVYAGKEGPFVITGCSHSGICNILTHALSLSGKEQAAGVIGGFHLMQKDAVLEKTVSFLAETVSGCLYPCHCVCLDAKCEMARVLPIREVGVGMSIEIR